MQLERTHLLAPGASKSGNLVQQSLSLPRRVLENLIPQVINLQPGGGGWVALSGLNARDLHLQKELGNLDWRKVPSRRADTGFGSQVDVELTLERSKIG